MSRPRRLGELEGRLRVELRTKSSISSPLRVAFPALIWLELPGLQRRAAYDEDLPPFVHIMGPVLKDSRRLIVSVEYRGVLAPIGVYSRHGRRMGRETQALRLRPDTPGIPPSHTRNNQGSRVIFRVPSTMFNRKNYTPLRNRKARKRVDNRFRAAGRPT